MKRAVSFFFLLACCGLLLADSPDVGRAAREPAPLLRDLVRMTSAGFSDETVLEYAKAHRAEIPSLVSADDLLWLRKSGVSESVVRYMTAIDVRASDQGEGEDIAYDSAEAAGHARYPPSAAYSYPDDYGYASSGYDSVYPDTDYYGVYPETYYADYYPFFGAGYYPYPHYFFVDNSGFFGRFHGRHHGFDGRRHGFDGRRHGFDGGRRGFDRRHGEGIHRGGFDRRSSSHGFEGRRGGMAAGPRGPGRPSFQGRGFGPGPSASRGAVMGRGGPRPAFSRGGSGPGFRAPQGGAGRGAFGHPGFSGGGRAAGGFGHGAAPRSGGGAPAGHAGGRGRR